MRIAIVTTSYPTHVGDASGHFVATEARALEGAGHAVTVIHPNPSGRSGDAFGWPGVMARLREDPTRTLDIARFVFRARRSLSDGAPFDRIIAHWLVPCAWPIAIAGSGALEVVAHGSDVRLLLRAPKLVQRHILSALCRRASRLRCVSHALRDALVNAYPALASIADVEPCALELGTPRSRVDARNAFGIAPEDAVIVIVSRLVRAKRVDVALRSVALFGGRAVVVGDGPERATLEAEFPNARFTGRVDRPIALEWIAAADLLLNASLEEGAPSAVREARALGTPVVTVPCGDLAQLAQRDSGLYVVRSPSE